MTQPKNTASNAVHDDDEIVFIKTTLPLKAADVARSERSMNDDKKRRNLGDEPSSDVQDNKRRRACRGTKENALDKSSARSSIMVSVVVDNGDNVKAFPGCLFPRSEWTDSSETTMIVQFIHQTDRWSCGYRNLQMLLSSILPHLPTNHYFFQKVPRRENKIVIPNLKLIQQTIETAWGEGYDPRGSKDYDNKLVGKTSWVGALDLAVPLAYWGFDAATVQFTRCQESREKLPDFIKSYFSKPLGKACCPFCTQTSFRSPSNQINAVELGHMLLTKRSTHWMETCRCPMLPLYLQWEGHSITVVGIKDDELVVFDPKELTRPTMILVDELVMKDCQLLFVSSFQSIPKTKQRKPVEKFVLTAALKDVLKASGVRVPPGLQIP